MKVNNSLKRYWATTGPNSVFGSDWTDRKYMSEFEAEQKFDSVWASTLLPAIQAGQKISATDAQSRIPDDGRMKYFAPHQQHRIFRLCGSTLLAQIDTNADRLTQMWHLKDKAGSDWREAPSTASVVNGQNSGPAYSSGPAYAPGAAKTPRHVPDPTAQVMAKEGFLTKLANRTGLSRAELAAAMAGILADLILRSE